MALPDYLENLLATAHIPVTFGPREPVSLSRWLVRSISKPSGRLWDEVPYLDESARILLASEASLLTGIDKEYQWSYYNSDIIGSHQDPSEPTKRFTRQPDHYLYALTSVYALEEADMLLYALAFLPSPLRIWVNGELVLTSHNEMVIKDSLLRLHLKEGLNTFLVEQPLDLLYPLTAQEFIIRLQPLARLEREKEELRYLDWDLYEAMKHKLLLCPSHWQGEPGEELGIMVLPRYAGAGLLGESVELRLETREGTPILTTAGTLGKRCTLRIPSSSRGAAVLKAKGAGFEETSTLVFIGPYDEERDRLLAALPSATGLSEDAQESFRRLMELPLAFAGLNQFMPNDCRQMLLDKLAEMKENLDALGAGHPIPLAKKMVRYRKRKTGDASIAYKVFLPDGYDSARRYPAVFFFHDAMARNYPVDLPWLKDLPQPDAILVEVVGIGRMNYTDDIRMVQLIDEITHEWRLDRDRLYVIGFCTGTHKAFKTAFAVPDLFAGIATVSGEIALNIYHPEYAWLDNLGELPVIGICGYENWFFNNSRMIELWKRLPGAERNVYSGFFHNELNLLNNSRSLFRRLLECRAERYPRWIAFTPTEPCFVKSHWLQILRLRKPGDLTRVQADLLCTDKLELETENVDRLRLVLPKKELGLEEKVTLFVNGSPCQVALGDYTCIELDTSELEARVISSVGWSAEAFHEWLNAVIVDEQQLGMKKVYLSACTVVRPVVRSAMFTKLHYLLQNPIKDRYIYYRYDSCREQEMQLAGPEERNWVLLVDARTPSEGQAKLLADVGVTADEDGISWQEERVSGDYFGMLTVSNPYSPYAGQLLLAITNTDELEEEWIGLLNRFDTHPLFYQDGFIYYRGGCRVFHNGSAASVTEEVVR
ncbi:hypothetical protein [Gorillibacterium sp. CAU 1737]|uniref:hypothetical protein n=1 Tax=Gorillibacterium sp. CAU 1737 TaxID=3140362 RepID=UPI00326143C5